MAMDFETDHFPIDSSFYSRRRPGECRSGPGFCITGKGKAFLPMKEKVTAKGRRASPLEDEEADKAALSEAGKEKEFGSTVKDVSAPEGEDYRSHNESEEPSGLRSSNTAWEKSTYEGVAQALKDRGIDPASVDWTPDTAGTIRQSSKRIMSVESGGRAKVIENATKNALIVFCPSRLCPSGGG